MTTYNEDEVTEAAILILKERYLFHKAESSRAMTYMIYMDGSNLLETENVAVDVVETVLRESNTALALFHNGERARYGVALQSLGVDLGTVA